MYIINYFDNLIKYNLMHYFPRSELHSPLK